MFCLIVLIICFTPVQSCSMTYYIQSNNQICKDRDCTATPVTSLFLVLGSQACFKSLTGEVQTLKFESATYRHVFRPLYQTCDYELKVASHARCKGAGECNADECKPSNIQDGRYPLNDTSELPNFFTGCAIQTTCDFYCGYNLDYRCVWARVWVEEENCLTVYEYTHTLWKLKLVFTNGQMSNIITIKEEDPFLKFPLSGIVMFPSSVHRIKELTHLIKVSSNKGIYLRAAPLDQAVPGMIGVYQKSLDGKTVKFPLQMLSNCETSSCEVQCTIPRSPLRDYTAFKEAEARYTTKELFKEESSEFGDLYTRESVSSAIITLVLDMKGLDMLEIQDARCDIGVQYTLGCTGCTEPVRVGIQASNVQIPGIYYINSNCSVRPSYLRCQISPYEIEILGTPKLCKIEAFRTPQRNGNATISFYITPEYQFYGSLTPVSYLAAVGHDDGWIGTATTLFSHPYFLNSLGWTLGVSAILGLLIRGVVSILGWKEGRSLSKDLKTAPSCPPENT